MCQWEISTVQTCVVTLGKWQGDRYTQGPLYTSQLCRKYKATESFGKLSPVTVIQYPVSCTPSVYAGHDCKNF